MLNKMFDFISNNASFIRKDYREVYHTLNHDHSSPSECRMYVEERRVPEGEDQGGSSLFVPGSEQNLFHVRKKKKKTKGLKTEISIFTYTVTDP